MTTHTAPPATQPHGGWQLTPGYVPGSWDASLPDPRRPIVVTEDVDRRIRRLVGLPAPEQGGLLGGSRLTGVVDVFEHDVRGLTTGTSWYPDNAWVNERVRAWRSDGHGLLGFVHSHPQGVPRLSAGDLVYAERLLEALPRLDRLVLPVVQTARRVADVDVLPWVVHRGTHGVVVDPVAWHVEDAPVGLPLEHPAFVRVTEAYDLPLLARARVVVIGCGGSAAMVEGLARSGIGELVLVDHDRVELANTATQAHSWLDVGRFKVHSAAERVHRASPLATTVAVPSSLDDLTDEQVEDLLHERLPGRPAPRVTLLVGATDSFAAQARTARLGLALQVPAMAAQVYAQGVGAEVTFAVPGHSTACQRCVLGSRYRYVETHGVPATASAGSPYTTTARLAALEYLVAMALLHGSGASTAASGARWRDVFARIATRNLVQGRCSPQADLPSLTRALVGADQDRLVLDETVWLPQEPESAELGFVPCADCGGTGDLTLPTARPSRPAQLPPARVRRLSPSRAVGLVAAACLAVGGGAAVALLNGQEPPARAPVPASPVDPVDPVDRIDPAPRQDTRGLTEH